MSGDVVVIQGPGPIGLLCAVAAREAGATLIVLTGVAEDGARLALAKELAADVVLDVTSADPVEALLDLTGDRKADRVLDTTGAVPAFEQGLAMTGTGGVFTVVGGYGTGRRVSLIGDNLLRQKIDIRFSHGVANAYQAAVAIITGGRYALIKIVTHTFPLEQALQALQSLDHQHNTGAVKVALDPTGTLDGK
jgi:threonine dehydrogenase-like Zn-dependent dehydrogenase